MTPDAALQSMVTTGYRFSHQSGSVHIQIMPSLQSVNIEARLMREMGGILMIQSMLVKTENWVTIATTSRQRIGSGDLVGADCQ